MSERRFRLSLRHFGRTAFLVTAAAVVAMFLWVSDGLVRDLSRQERERMQVWADATREMVRVLSDDSGAAAPIPLPSPTMPAIYSSTATSACPNSPTRSRP